MHDEPGAGLVAGMEPRRPVRRDRRRAGDCARRVLILGALAGTLGAACSGDDDTETSDASTPAATCDAYDEVTAAVAVFADLDPNTVEPGTARDALEDVVLAVTDLSAATGVDDDDLLADINAVLAEIPDDADPQNDQLALTALRSSQDIIVGDVNAWLGDLPVTCD